MLILTPISYNANVIKMNLLNSCMISHADFMHVIGVDWSIKFWMVPAEPLILIKKTECRIWLCCTIEKGKGIGGVLVSSDNIIDYKDIIFKFERIFCYSACYI